MGTNDLQIVQPAAEEQQPQEARPLTFPAYRRTYRYLHTPDAEEQRCTREALRYKWGGYRMGVRFMQWLGDFFR